MLGFGKGAPGASGFSTLAVDNVVHSVYKAAVSQALAMAFAPPLKT
jgi:hypothetical protein